MAALLKLILSPETIDEFREELIEHGKASYPSFGGDGLVLPGGDIDLILPWGSELSVNG